MWTYTVYNNYAYSTGGFSLAVFFSKCQINTPANFCGHTVDFLLSRFKLQS